MFEQIKRLQEAASKAQIVLDLIEKAKVQDADKDGHPDYEQLKELGPKVVRQIEAIHLEIDKLRELLEEGEKVLGANFEEIKVRLGL